MAGLVLAGEEGADPHHMHPLPAQSAGGSTVREPRSLLSQTSLTTGGTGAMKVGKDIVVGAGAIPR